MDEDLKLQETANSLRIIHGKPLINYTIEALENIEDIHEIFVVTNGLYYPKFQLWEDHYSFTKKVKVINDNTTSSEAKLGAIGDIRYTINSENIDEDILVLAGDAYFDFSLADFVRYYQEKGTSVVAGKVVGMQEKPLDPVGNIISLAAYIYPREVLRDFEYYLSEGNQTTYPGYFVEYLYKIKPVYVYQIIGNYYDTKTMKSIENIEQRLS